MRAFVCPKVVTVPAEVLDSNQSCVPYLRENLADNISTFRLVPVGKAPEEFRINAPSGKKTRPSSRRSVTRLVPESTNTDTCGHNFLFDKRWRNGMFSKNNFKDGEPVKPTSILPPVSLDFQNHQSHILNKLLNQKQLFYGITKPCSFGSYEEYGLVSVPSVKLSVTTPPISGRNNVTGGFKNRPRVNKRGCNHFTAGFNTSSKHIIISYALIRIVFVNQSYPDPVPGAPALFLQRLLEISSLEGETVHEEKSKNPKKSHRQES
ncbi:hypothetical protein P4O66_004856 [Electrophorus voltai]|uniref:Uncharacterized protein n=1 Tax=Electrophorus voltai TaxID=2609070 RepID=A0AAD9E4L8_9TELE|nr:hypothetical protein P4O66_004856 [Electrophorus voltai]